MQLQGLATGIGSLPHKESSAALDLIFKYAPNIPFWPQLPKRDFREGMLAQFSENLPCITIKQNDVVFDSSQSETELERFYDRIIARDVDYFEISREYSQGFSDFYERLKKNDLREVEYLKGHITGPFTFAASLVNEQGVALLHDEVFMQVIVKGLAMKALWQVEKLRKFGKKIIIFFDEPYLGCFGSAYTPVTKEAVVTGLEELVSTIKSGDVLTGVHCCGNTDWSIFTDVQNLDIINFDAFGFFDKLSLFSEDLKKFFSRDGILCWGIVPTQDFSLETTSSMLLQRIEAGKKALAGRGINKAAVERNLLVSPSCGLGTLDPGKSEQIFRCLSEISSALKP